MNSQNRYINKFTLQDVGIKKEVFLKNIQPMFNDLPWDYYDCRKSQIDFLSEKLPKYKNDLKKLFQKYYNGDAPYSTLTPYVDLLNSTDSLGFFKLRPFRRRMISEFVLQYKQQWVINRIPINQFSQTVESNDYRNLSRCFTELETEKTNCKYVKLLINSIANKLKKQNSNIQYLNIVIFGSSVLRRGSGSTSKN